ncbi:MAG: hypothetical protein GY934_05105 [Gammaproteobacteria bacterium]|nr:hypothetical protein [Gammaproteobacteria bacterium]
MAEYTEEHLEKLASAAAGKAVQSTLIALGIDAHNPLEVQRDMQFARNLRTLSENAGRKAILTVIGVIVVAIIALIAKSIWST